MWHMHNHGNGSFVIMKLFEKFSLRWKKQSLIVGIFVGGAQSACNA